MARVGINPGLQAVQSRGRDLVGRMGRKQLYLAGAGKGAKLGALLQRARSFGRAVLGGALAAPPGANGLLLFFGAPAVDHVDAEAPFRAHPEAW